MAKKKKFKYSKHNPLKEMVLETFGDDVEGSEEATGAEDVSPEQTGSSEQERLIPVEQDVSADKSVEQDETQLYPENEISDISSQTEEPDVPDRSSMAGDSLPSPSVIASFLPTSISLDPLRQSGILPIRIDQDVLTVAVPSMDLYPAAQMLGSVFGRAVDIEIHDRGDIDRIIRVLYDIRSGVADETVQAVEGIEDINDLAREDVLSDSVDVPVIKLVNGLILDATRQRATDIHIEPYEDHVQVRFRIDGVLNDRLSLPRSHQSPLTSRLKVMARLDIAEHMIPQDGRIGITIGGRAVDIRVGIVPTQHGERIALRLLDKAQGVLTLQDLGMADMERKTMEDLISSPHGMILFTGPTGSGKTTTMYAILQALARPEVNIITVEDPIEYDLPGVAQIQVNEKAGVTFASALRSILRQDPDIVMIGEMRDFDTAHIGVQASLTGHLVLSTLHTNDSVSAVIRLIDMGIEPYLASGSLIGSVAQRLVRRVCPHCRSKAEPPGIIRSQGIETVYRGKGCEHCNWTGYRGRVGLYEHFVVNPAIAEAISSSAPASELRKLARKEGFRTLWEIGLNAVSSGVTSPEELLRVTGED